MKEPLLSVIIPVYKTELWLRKCLDSVCSQSYTNLEIICVNDGSPDSSAEILAEYAAKDGRITVITQENRGLAAARNAALRVARGEYVTGVDSDDSLAPDVYIKLLPWLEKRVDMVCYGINGVSEDGESVENEYFHLPAHGERVVDARLLLNTNVYMWNKVFRTELIRKHEIWFPDGMLYEDLVFFYLSGVLCRTICYVPDARYCYLIRGSSITNGEQAQNRAFDFCKILEILYTEFCRRGMMGKWSDLYRQIFLLYYEQTVPILPSSRQRAARKIYKSMVLRLGLHKLYKGEYPFQELSHYSFLRSLFFWRNQSRRVFKFLKWVVLQIEETPEGRKKTWF